MYKTIRLNIGNFKFIKLSLIKVNTVFLSDFNLPSNKSRAISIKTISAFEREYLSVLYSDLNLISDIS